jgi:hypothetical protein
MIDHPTGHCRANSPGNIRFGPPGFLSSQQECRNTPIPIIEAGQGA